MEHKIEEESKKTLTNFCFAYFSASYKSIRAYNLGIHQPLSWTPCDIGQTLLSWSTQYISHHTLLSGKVSMGALSLLLLFILLGHTPPLPCSGQAPPSRVLEEPTNLSIPAPADQGKILLNPF